MCPFQDFPVENEFRKRRRPCRSANSQIRLSFPYPRRWLIKQFVKAENFLGKASCWDWTETSHLLFSFHMPLVSHRHCSRDIEMAFPSPGLSPVSDAQFNSLPAGLALRISLSIWLNPLSPRHSQTPSHISSLEYCPSIPKTKPHAPQQALGQVTTKLHSLPQPPSPAQPSSKP